MTDIKQLCDDSLAKVTGGGEYLIDYVMRNDVFLYKGNYTNIGIVVTSYAGDLSSNAKSCWNIAPSGMKGLDATLYYISRMKANEGKITCKFSV